MIEKQGQEIEVGEEGYTFSRSIQVIEMSSGKMR